MREVFGEYWPSLSCNVFCSQVYPQGTNQRINNDMDDQAQSYDNLRTERHRAMTSPDEVIDDAVWQACGSRLCTKDRITEGFSNEVYAATTEDGRRVVVRIHWHGSPHFEAEQWALNRCAEIGLPAPRFLRLQSDPSTTTPHDICVETYLSGRSLHSLVADGEMDVAGARPILIETGSILAQLHTIPATGFGRIDGRGIAESKSWQAYVDQIPIERLQQAAQNVGVAPSEISEARRLLHDHRAIWQDWSPRLLHGDLSPQHIMVWKKNVSGLIDFEYPQSGDPAMDLAYWGYWSPFQGTAFPLDWLLEGYQRHTPIDEPFELRIAACRLQMSLEKLSYHGIQDRESPAMCAFLRNSFARDLAALRPFSNKTNHPNVT
jgi:aminoglycoside phosphotransferase (APT) family kinase protein